MVLFFTDSLLVIRKYLHDSIKVKIRYSKTVQQTSAAGSPTTECVSRAATSRQSTAPAPAADPSGDATCTCKGFSCLHLEKTRILCCDTAHERVLAPYDNFHSYGQRRRVDAHTASQTHLGQVRQEGIRHNI